MSSVEDMFPGVQGSVRREKIRERYGINAEEVGGDRILPCKLDGNGHPDVNKKIIERHPLNDRRYKELENQYAKRMLTDGYDNEDAGAMSLVATDSSRKLWLAIGGATRCQAFLNAYAIQPDNLQLDAFIKAGGYKASYYKESMPDVVVHWLVLRKLVLFHDDAELPKALVHHSVKALIHCHDSKFPCKLLPQLCQRTLDRCTLQVSDVVQLAWQALQRDIHGARQGVARRHVHTAPEHVHSSFTKSSVARYLHGMLLEL